MVVTCLYFVWHQLFVGNSTKKQIPACACSPKLLGNHKHGVKMNGTNFLTNWEEIIISVVPCVDIRGHVLTCAEVGCESQQLHIWGKKKSWFSDSGSHLWNCKRGKIISGNKIDQGSLWEELMEIGFCQKKKTMSKVQYSHSFTLGHDCMIAAGKFTTKYILICGWAKWFPVHSWFHFFAFTPHGRCTLCSFMHPGFAPRFVWLYKKPQLAPVCDYFYQAVWVTCGVHFGRISNCNNVFWGRDLSLHVYELRAVK